MATYEFVLVPANSIVVTTLTSCRNMDCQEAYARYTCWLNFPRCSDDFDESLPMCQSGELSEYIPCFTFELEHIIFIDNCAVLPACENLFRVCGFASDIWRCEAGLASGEDEYDLRAFFPGQPLVSNQFHPKSGDPIEMCTPSIKGAAFSRWTCVWPYLVVFIALLCSAAWL